MRITSLILKNVLPARACTHAQTDGRTDADINIDAVDRPHPHTHNTHISTQRERDRERGINVIDR